MALPLQFSLRPSRARRRDAPFAPCLSVRCPTPDRPWQSVEVVRLLDPEHREPLVSLARLCAAAEPPIPPRAVLARFLSPSSNPSPYPSSLAAALAPSYSVVLSGMAPFADFWVPLKVARQVAESVGLLDQLGGLLKWETRTAWSCIEWTTQSGRSAKSNADERRGELVSNWRLPATALPSSQYSVDALCRTTFGRLDMLSGSTSLRLPFSFSGYHDAFSPPPASPAQEHFDDALSSLCVLCSSVMEDRSSSAIVKKWSPVGTLGPSTGTASGSGLLAPVMEILDSMAAIVRPAPPADDEETVSHPFPQLRAIDALQDVLFKLGGSPDRSAASPPALSEPLAPPPTAAKGPLASASGPDPDPDPDPALTETATQLDSLRATVDAILLHLRQQQQQQPPQVGLQPNPPLALKTGIPTVLIVGAAFVAGVTVGLAIFGVA